LKSGPGIIDVTPDESIDEWAAVSSINTQQEPWKGRRLLG